MGLEDYLIDVALIAVVVRQLRGRRLTTAGLLWPLPLVAWAGAQYLGPVPTRGHDSPWSLPPAPWARSWVSRAPG